MDTSDRIYELYLILRRRSQELAHHWAAGKSSGYAPALRRRVVSLEIPGSSHSRLPGRLTRDNGIPGHDIPRIPVSRIPVSRIP